MNKKTLGLVAVALMLASIARAAGHTSAGCGLGSMLFEGKNKKVHLVLAATTNGTFGNQTFGISSDTLGCTSEGVAKNDKRLDIYAEVNLRRLSQEMAQGGGEYLSGLASLLGVKGEEAKKAFFRLTQEKYAKLFPSETTDAPAMLKTLRLEMSADPALRTL